jgi:hypothetical protein
MNRLLFAFATVAAVLLSGCATVAPKDYTEFRKSNPRSILVLPPLNESTDVIAPYSVLTTISQPLAELGYYVFPVVMVDQYFKANGLTVPGEMHQAPLEKLREVFGTDAVLYLTVEKYGSKYQVISSTTTVSLRGRLVDARSGTLLWEGSAHFENGGAGGGSGGIEGLLVAAVMNQIMSKSFDQAHTTAVIASSLLINSPQQGLLRGSRHPDQFGGTGGQAVR